MAKSPSTRFVILAGRHPAALLAADDDLPQIQACVERAQEEEGCDWLLWLGDKIPRVVSDNLSCQELVYYEANPDNVEAVLGQIRRQIGELGDLVRLKIVIVTPLVHRGGDWWAIGTPGEGSESTLLPLGFEWEDLDLEAEPGPDGYVFHLVKLLESLLPEVPDDVTLPRAQVHVVFHEYRLWSSREEQLPFDMPNEQDFEELREHSPKLRDAKILRHGDPEWTPALDRPPAPVGRGPTDPDRRRRILKPHPALESPYPHVPCVICSGDDRRRWLSKLQLLLDALGIRWPLVISFGRPYQPIPKDEKTGAVILLREVALDFKEIEDWLGRLATNRVPVCLVDSYVSDAGADPLETWRLTGKLGEEKALDQALWIAEKSADRPTPQWNLHRAVDNLTDVLHADGDEFRASVWEDIRRHFGRASVGEGEDRIAVRRSIERLLKESPRELLELVVHSYDEAAKLFEGERSLHLRLAPAACLKILGTLKTDDLLYREEPEPQDPCLSLHVGDTSFENVIYSLWTSRYRCIVEESVRDDPADLAARLDSGGLFVFVLVDGGHEVDWDMVRREAELSIGKGGPVLLLSLAEMGKARWRRLARGSRADVLESFWEGARSRLGASEDERASGKLVAFVPPWGEGSPSAIEVLGLDEALAVLAQAPGALAWLKEVTGAFILAYSEIFRARNMLIDAGLSPADFAEHPRPRDYWFGIVFDLGVSGIDRLIRAALEDPAAAGFHDRFRELGDRRPDAFT